MNGKWISMLTMTVALLVMVVLGCGKADENAADHSAETTATQGMEKAGETVIAAFDQMKADYVEKAEQMVTEWETKIGDLVAKKGALPKMAQKPLEEPMTMLEDQKGALIAQFDKLKGADEETFDTEKAAFEQVTSSVSDAYAKVAGLF
ncbi:MAG: hypothetical protein ABIE70_09240 [bacterium]